MHVVILVPCGWQVDLVLEKSGACSFVPCWSRDTQFGPLEWGMEVMLDLIYCVKAILI